MNEAAGRTSHELPRWVALLLGCACVLALGCGSDDSTEGPAAGTGGNEEAGAGSDGGADADASGSGGAGGSSPSKDGGVELWDADIQTSPECTAFCQKLSSLCCRACNFVVECTIDPGQCATSTRAFLQCEVDQGQWNCGDGTYSIFSSCHLDASLCN